MGRPSASPENRAFAVFLAHAVTKKSHSRFDFVARSGPLSLFSALAKMFPAYARTEDGRGFRDGVSEVQLNKELQKNGFQRVRDRRTCATRKSEDPTGAGMYLFSYLQWRDPSVPEDREILVSKYNEMVEKFPLIMLSCKMEKFLDVLDKFAKEWAISTEQMNEVELEEEGHNSDATSEPAQRSTSVSPVISAADSASFMNNLRVLAAAKNPPSPSFFPQNSVPLHFNMVSKPMTPMNGAMRNGPMMNPVNGAHQNLNNLQSQLTNSLLAVTLAKQQLQAASSVTNLNMQKGMLNPFGNIALQQALLSPEPVASTLSPFSNLNVASSLPMQLS